MADRNLDIIPLYEWGMFTEPRPSVVAGPCSAESEEQVMETAKGLKELGINVFRAGIWKPRTHPGSFEGVGSEGLEWMRKAKEEYGLKISTEVASEKHVFECLKYGVDLIRIGARTTANPFIMQEIALCIEAHHLTARAVARVDCQYALLPQGCRQEQLLEISSKHAYGLLVSLSLGAIGILCLYRGA